MMPDVAPAPIGPSPVPSIPTPEPVIPSIAAASAPLPAAPIDLSQSTSPMAAQPASDLTLAGGPIAIRDGQPVELTRYRQAGKIELDGDTVTQQIGRGRTTEYSLEQLATHSKDPEYFQATMRYAVKNGESVTIDVHAGVSRVIDPALEHSLPKDMPLREPILRASVIHEIDPKLLAAVGVQETHLGADYLGPSVGYDKATHRGDVEPNSPGGHGYGPFQYDDAQRLGEVARPKDELDRIAHDPYRAADKAASMLRDNLDQTGGNVRDALHLYNAGTLNTPTRTTDWGPSIGKLPYEESAMRYYGEIATQVQSQDLGRTR